MPTFLLYEQVQHGVSHLPVNYDFVDLVESKEADIGHQVMAMQDLEERPQQSYQVIGAS